MHDELDEENLILIGSAGRNSGKTTLACRLLGALKARYDITALKITSIERAGGVCPRGGEGCGACSIAGAFALTEEKEDAAGAGGADKDKDTRQLLRAGARRVFWLRCLRSALKEGFEAFKRASCARAGFTCTGLDCALCTRPAPALVLCESNSLREVVRPALFIMLVNKDEGVKKSAEKVMALANLTLPSPFNDDDFEKVVKEFERRRGGGIL